MQRRTSARGRCHLNLTRCPRALPAVRASSMPKRNARDEPAPGQAAWWAFDGINKSQMLGGTIKDDERRELQRRLLHDDCKSYMNNLTEHNSWVVEGLKPLTISYEYYDRNAAARARGSPRSSASTSASATSRCTRTPSGTAGAGEEAVARASGRVLSLTSNCSVTALSRMILEGLHRGVCSGSAPWCRRAIIRRTTWNRRSPVPARIPLHQERAGIHRRRW